MTTRRRLIIIVVSITTIILALSGLIVGLTIGLARNSKNPTTTIYSNISNETCIESGYVIPINSSSISGKYSSSAITTASGECSRIGRQILEHNGTAVDAAIAAAICTGVLCAHSMGIGGGAIMVIYSKERQKTFSLVGREQAPSAANSTMFVGREHMSTIGGLAIAVPGELRTYRKAYLEFGGGVSWKELFQPTIDLCRQGFIIAKSQAIAINETASFILKDPGLREIFVKNNLTNELYGEGDFIKRIKLGRTLEIIADEGDDAFYTGQLSDLIVKEIQDQNGIITKQDLANYQVDFREALNININQSLTAYLSYPPASGIIYSFIFNILKGYNFNSNDLEESTTASLFYHRLIESFKFAYAKRSELGDPQKINITQLISDLTSTEYADNIRKRINDYKTFGYEYYGGNWSTKDSHGTAHLSVVDKNGNAVAMTSTINTYFGSTVAGIETGIIYNNQMDSFSTPNTSNSFGVPASPSNYIEGGKRPTSSMTPIIIFDNINQHVQQIIGGSGGTRITTNTAQVSMINLIFNKNIQESIDLPRIHSQLLPEQVPFEINFNQTILEELKQRGHQLICSTEPLAIVQGIEWSRQYNQWWATSDKREGGEPDGI